MSAFGSISTIAIIYIYSVFPKKATKFLLFLGITLFIISSVLVYNQFIREQLFALTIDYIFMFIGFALTAIIFYNLLKSFSINQYSFFKTDRFIIFLFIGGISLFIIRFAPFNATRHVLLVIPFVIILSDELIERADKQLINLTIATSIFLGLVLGVSDWVSADFYRKSANKINVDKRTVWSVGHWGWQWYSNKHEMAIYSKGDDVKLRNGEVIVFPKNTSRQAISDDIYLDTIDFITEEPTILTFFSGKNFASMYNSYVHKPAWTLSNRCIDTIFVCKVKKEIGVLDIINRIKKDENWMSLVKLKAIQNSIPLDTMLVLDAKWVINQQRK